jgi:hypothetical protein
MPGLIPVVIYGNSLFLSSVELALRQCGEWTVLRLDPVYAGARAELKALQEGILVFDAADVEAQFAPDFLAAHPRMALVGLDTAGGRALVWRGEQRAMAHLDQLNDLLCEMQQSAQD